MAFYFKNIININNLILNLNIGLNCKSKWKKEENNNLIVIDSKEKMAKKKNQYAKKKRPYFKNIVC